VQGRTGGGRIGRTARVATLPEPADTDGQAEDSGGAIHRPLIRVDLRPAGLRAQAGRLRTQAFPGVFNRP